MAQRLYGDAARAEMRRYSDARIGKWAYGNAWNNIDDLDTRDSADCSDWTDALYTHLGYPLPGMSYQQAEQGEEVYTWSGPRGQAVAAFNAIAHKLVGGELVCMAIDRARPGKISHTEAYYTSGMSYGHGGPGRGPTYHNIGRADLLAYADRFTIRRIIHETPTEEDMTPDQSKTLNKLAATSDKLAYAVNDIILPALARLDNARSAEAARDAAQTATIATLAKSQGLDAAQVRASIDKAVSEALEGLTVTLEAK